MEARIPPGDTPARLRGADVAAGGTAGPDFRALFEAAPGLYLVVRADAPHFPIVAASDAYLRATLTTREGPGGILGRGLFEALPHAPGAPHTTGARKLRDSLERAAAAGAPDAMDVQPYAVCRPDGTWEERHWSPLNTPVADPSTGRVTHIIHRVEDVTEALRLAGANEQLQEQAVELEMRSAELHATTEALAERTDEAHRARQRVAGVLESISDAFFALDREWRFTYVNDRAEQVLFRRRDEILGRNVWEEFAPAAGSAFEREYRRAMANGEAVVFEEWYAPLERWFAVHAYPGPDGLAVYFQDVTERRRAEAAGRASQRRAAFAGDVGLAITGGGSLGDVLQRCCQAAVEQLDAAFARAWVLDADEPVLVLLASAGLYTHLDGAHGRVPVGQFKIGQIAADRRPHVTNTVVGDPRVHDQAWAQREGMVAFAGYPLVVGEQLVGVFAVFAREALGEAEVAALGTAATAVSVAVSNARLLASERRARAEAEAARQVAETANRAKSEFLAVMSHELRTPLNAIGGYAELIEMGVHGPVTPEQRNALERVQRSQRHLLGLINGVLNYAKVDAGAVHYDRDVVRLDEVLVTCESLIAPQVRAKGLALRHDAGDGTPRVRADREKVQQVVLNLLSNAVKFTEPGGAITLACERQAGAAQDAGTVVVRVSDTGRGIAADQLERVFQPFVQVDARLTRTEEGTGLGLAISRDLARGMGGDLSVESVPGAGSTFTLTLPRA